MSDILKTYNVSRETIDKLKTYEKLVLEWNNRFNLISKSSVECIWNRHILDSVQLCKYINNKDNILYDFGSGAGFPAIVIAIVSVTPVTKKLKEFIISKCDTHKKQTAFEIASIVIPVILLILSTLTLVGDSYNPFLYFQF
jgi:16S rRNA (guanine527-N7)-methyltransferase